MIWLQTVITLSLVATCALAGTIDARTATKQVIVDFTHPETAAKVALWRDPEYVEATTEGLALKAKDSDYRNLAVELREPAAVGWSWCPVTSVRVKAQVVTAGKSHLRDSGSAEPTRLYVRYSPDRRHWSTWQALSGETAPKQKDPVARFQGILRVPKKSQRQYRRLLREYVGPQRIPEKIDHEAAVREILAKEPAFFSKELSFIGYVELLLEARIKGDTRLKRMSIEFGYSRADRGSVPPGHREQDAWRFRIPGDAENRAKKPLELSESADGTSVSVAADTLIFILLPGSRATGYEWDDLEITGEAVRQTGKITYDEDSKPDVVGQPGLFRISLKTVKTGTSTVKLAYRRPWEKKRPPARTFTVTVEVK